MTARPRSARGAKPKPFSEIMAGAKLPQDTLAVCLRGDLVAEFELLDRDLRTAQEAAKQADSLDGGDVEAILEAMDAVQAAMREDTYDFRFQALPKPKFRALIAAHPPRRGDDNEVLPADGVLGLNRETFFPTLIRACTIDPVLNEGEWRELLGDSDAERAEREAAGEPVEDGKLTDRQYGDIEDKVWFLNRDVVSVPFSRAASLARRTSGDE